MPTIPKTFTTRGLQLIGSYTRPSITATQDLYARLMRNAATGSDDRQGWLGIYCRLFADNNYSPSVLFGGTNVWGEGTQVVWTLGQARSNLLVEFRFAPTEAGLGSWELHYPL